MILNGMSYERATIEEVVLSSLLSPSVHSLAAQSHRVAQWFDRCEALSQPYSAPDSNAVLGDRTVLPNRNLRHAIEDWLNS